MLRRFCNAPDFVDIVRTGRFIKNRSRSTSVEVEAEVPLVTAKVTAFTAIAGAAPEGKLRDDADDDLSKAKSRMLVLKRKQTKFGANAMLQKDYDLDAIAKDIADLDIFIAALIARKAELGG